jgi:hypothetical protein
MFSCAGRTTFFGGMMSGDLALEDLTMFNPNGILEIKLLLCANSKRQDFTASP